MKSEGGGAESDSDDELETGGQTQNFKDPLTYTTLKEPYTSYVHLSERSLFTETVYQNVSTHTSVSLSGMLLSISVLLPFSLSLLVH